MSKKRDRQGVTGKRDRRKVRVTYDLLADLLGRPDNPKGHDVAAIEESVGAVGYVEPIVVNDSDGRILSGHGRVEALRAMRERGEDAPDGITVSRGGEWRVPVLHGVELTDEDAQRYVLAANQTTILGGWEDGALVASLASLAETEAGLLGTGFIDDDLAALRAALNEPAAGQTDPDAVPPVADEPYVQRGELYALGAHRLLCGDATSAEDVERLLDGGTAYMIFTDPPYGVGYRGGTRPRHAMDGDKSCELAAAGLRIMATFVDAGGAVYCCSPPGSNSVAFGRAFIDAGLHYAATLVWAKDNSAFGRSDYQWMHEPIIYGWRLGAAHRWHGDRKQTTVWQIPRPARSDEHPTMKPVELIERAIVNSSRLGDAVLDPFLGSGTTLIAAERLGRRCYAMEIDPRYVQVAIERWEMFTGRSAERLDG